MRTTLRLALLMMLVALPGAAEVFDHSLFDRVLKDSVNQIGEVNYGRLKQNPADLDRYVRALAEASPASRPGLFPTRDHQLAYWLNAYNAFVLKAVSAEYPVKSVRDLGLLFSFFWRRKFVAGGQPITLLHLEDEIIRKQFRDPRIHFALVCASISCPFLPREAFTGPALQAQLDAAARLFVNQRRNFTVEAASNQVYLSGLYNLRDYESSDFLADLHKQNPSKKLTMLDYLRRYLTSENLKKLDGLKNPKIKFYDYDWSINDLGSRARARLPQERELSRQ